MTMNDATSASRLVPSVPDMRMTMAFHNLFRGPTGVTAEAAWAAMLAAAPTVPEQADAISRTAGDVLVFVYRNYKGEVAERRVAADGVSFYVGTTGWHPERQMLMAGWDLDKRAQRDFAVRDILHFGRMSEAHGISALPSIRSFQERVQPWMLACFGEEVSADRLERGDRLLEEVLELLQSGDYPVERVAALRDYVWSRKKGEPSQEAGGVAVTLAAYCSAHDIDMHGAAETELARIWTKVDVIRAKQAAKPVGSALPVAIAAPAPAADGLREAAISAAVIEYGLVDNVAGEHEKMGRHSAIRGMMVRLGYYDAFNAALNDDEPSAALSQPAESASNEEDAEDHEAELEEARTEGFNEGYAEGKCEAKGAHGTVFRYVYRWLDARGLIYDDGEGIDVNDVEEGLRLFQQEPVAYERQRADAAEKLVEQRRVHLEALQREKEVWRAQAERNEAAVIVANGARMSAEACAAALESSLANAAEDARDALYKEALEQMTREPGGSIESVAIWLSWKAMLPADRGAARLDLFKQEGGKDV